MVKMREPRPDMRTGSKTPGEKGLKADVHSNTHQNLKI